MGLFNKELRDYKVMEKYKKSLDTFDMIGETEKYRLYLDKRLKQYIVRQEKQNPKNVVYLGWLRGEFCVFYNRIFYINKISLTGRPENPLNYIDIETGRAGSMTVLSNKGSWIGMHWHCQDVVKSFGVYQDTLVMVITRYKENAHDEKEFSYSIFVTCSNGQFHVRHEFPDSSEIEQTNNQNLVKDSTAKMSLSNDNEPTSRQSGLTYGSDIALQPKEKPVHISKVTYDTETVGCGLAELALKELSNLMTICSKYTVSFDERKLLISTFAYYFEVWLFNFASITVKQADEVGAAYVENFKLFNRKQYEDDSYKSVLENETRFEQMLHDVDRSIRDSYHANNRRFLDDGLSDSFVLSFIINPEDKDKIKGVVSDKIFNEWAYTAQQAEKQMEIK